MKMMVMIPMALSLLRLRALRQQEAIDDESYKLLVFFSSFAMVGVLM